MLLWVIFGLMCILRFFRRPEIYLKLLTNSGVFVIIRGSDPINELYELIADVTTIL